VKKTHLIVIALLVLITIVIGSELGATGDRGTPNNRNVPSPPELISNSECKRPEIQPLWSAFPLDTFVLAEYTFDSNGSPDPQGWVSHDASADGLFFHIDGFSGLADYAPL
jgi:hypothetical protein